MAAQAIAYGGLAALQLAGSYFASQNIKETALLNKEISDMNAEFAELDAYDAIIEGYTQEAKYQSIIDKTLGEQQLALTSQDIDVNYGSAAEFQKESRFTAELNKMEIEKQAQEASLGYKREARNIRMQSALDYSSAKSKASTVMFQGVTSAAQTGLTGYQRSR